MDQTAKIKHLEFIQAVITRHNANSFLLKGWGTTLVSALLVLEAKASLGRIAFLAMLVLFAFWALDAFYLTQERRFRALYDYVRESKEDLNFSMDVTLAKHRPHYAGGWSSFTVYWFWAVLLLVVLFAWMYYA